MALLAGNIQLSLEWSDSSNLSQYISDSNSFAANSEQYICIRGADLGGLGGSANALGVPTTLGVVWTKIDHTSRDTGVVALYKATMISEVTGVTTIDYPAVQQNCAICIVQVTNAEITIEQSKTGSWSGGSGSVTIDDIAYSVGNLALNFVASCDYASKDYTAGTNETALTGTSNKNIFVQYNFTEDTLDVGTPIGGDYGSIGIEVAEIGVVPDEDTVTMCTLALIDKTTEVAATALVEGEKYEIVTQGTSDFMTCGAANNDPGTVFTADSNAPITGTGTTLHIIPCICESALGFEIGMTAELWPGNVENDAVPATLIQAIDTAPTATPRFNVTFSAAVASGVDTLHITYVAGGATGGDIKSVTGGIALASATFDATTAMSC